MQCKTKNAKIDRSWRARPGHDDSPPSTFFRSPPPSPFDDDDDDLAPASSPHPPPLAPLAPRPPPPAPPRPPQHSRAQSRPSGSVVFRRLKYPPSGEPTERLVPGSTHAPSPVRRVPSTEISAVQRAYGAVSSRQRASLADIHPSIHPSIIVPPNVPSRPRPGTPRGAEMIAMCE
ncbi:hypothetical protein Mp_3g08220 [Marchantia polymorpha subsp. ruderalis]|uniref:Uncharacterized protein n=2 Tax=Marchantia polymorpha TaxID=3197 RepID=A0AAF6AYM0_MARPO|nr:hypothetical protein MARPO_0006s0296 [Marchantia polymorpha]BBN04854.1 hypothetical protein Mp_3g08220 [Marchantia polymorpha subsp. ruderalis]|eukprot:PTQ48305.1 hypothetical protein MARPO_0006s0296 [Marchantia polymorpha]